MGDVPLSFPKQIIYIPSGCDHQICINPECNFFKVFFSFYISSKDTISYSINRYRTLFSISCSIVEFLDFYVRGKRRMQMRFFMFKQKAS